MIRISKLLMGAACLLCLSLANAEAVRPAEEASNDIPADMVFFDNGVGMTKDELEQVIKYWTPEMRQAAANDVGDRFELISMSLASKKIAEDAGKMTPEADGDWYWKKEFLARNAVRQIMVEQYLASLVVPDMTALAKERYEVDKENIALEPERRLTSHILFMCRAGCADREAQRQKAEKVLAELKAGADFGELAVKHSEDLGTGKKKGLYDKWLARDEPHVDGHYLMGAYGLDKPGDISEIIESRFGFHIIRLEEIKEEYVPTFEEVKEELVTQLEHKYRKDMAIEFDRKYRFSDDGFIDGKAMEEVFAPYKTKEPKPPVEKARPVEPAVDTE